MQRTITLNVLRRATKCACANRVRHVFVATDGQMCRKWQLCRRCTAHSTLIWIRKTSRQSSAILFVEKRRNAIPNEYNSRIMFYFIISFRFILFRFFANINLLRPSTHSTSIRSIFLCAEPSGHIHMCNCVSFGSTQALNVFHHRECARNEIQQKRENAIFK